MQSVVNKRVREQWIDWGVGQGKPLKDASVVGSNGGASASGKTGKYKDAQLYIEKPGLGTFLKSPTTYRELAATFKAQRYAKHRDRLVHELTKDLNKEQPNSDIVLASLKMLDKLGKGAPITLLHGLPADGKDRAALRAQLDALKSVDPSSVIQGSISANTYKVLEDLRSSCEHWIARIDAAQNPAPAGGVQLPLDAEWQQASEGATGAMLVKSGGKVAAVVKPEADADQIIAIHTAATQINLRATAPLPFVFANHRKCNSNESDLARAKYKSPLDKLRTELDEAKDKIKDFPAQRKTAYDLRGLTGDVAKLEALNKRYRELDLKVDNGKATPDEIKELQVCREEKKNLEKDLGPILADVNKPFTKLENDAIDAENKFKEAERAFNRIGGQQLIVQSGIEGSSLSALKRDEKLTMIKKPEFGNSLGLGIVVLPLLGLNDHLAPNGAGNSNFTNFMATPSDGLAAIDLTRRKDVLDSKSLNGYLTLVNDLRKIANSGSSTNLSTTLKNANSMQANAGQAIFEGGAAASGFLLSQDEARDLNDTDKDRLAGNVLRGIVDGIEYFETNITVFDDVHQNQLKGQPGAIAALKDIFAQLTPAERQSLKNIAAKAGT